MYIDKLHYPLPDKMKFQAISWFAGDVDETYIIKAFGADADGNSVCLSLDDFLPYFYVKVPMSWNARYADMMLSAIEKALPDVNIDRIKLFQRKDFWGFTNETLFLFARIEFKNLDSFKKTRYMFERRTPLYIAGKEMKHFPIYEANIDPFIRIMHIKNIKPSGWISVDDEHLKPVKTLPSTCKTDVMCSWRKIEHFENNSFGKFKIASFDIECSSSHGDFPVPQKTYKKYANELYDIYMQNEKSTEYHIVEKIKLGLYSMFGIDGGDGCSVVYAKKKITNISKLQVNIDNGVDDIYGIISNKHSTKECIIQSLLTKFSLMKFPDVKGDEIIQIGVTVHTYGSNDCSEKHVLVLGTCDEIDDIDVRVFEHEKDLLLAFRSLIVDEIDPDVITGYNINGFDFWFVYNRCIELGIWDEFSELGRLKDQSCKYVEQKLTSSALGDNLLKYIDMPGRIIVDIMKVVQRDHKLDSYKLDNVASHFLKQNKNDISPQDIFRLQKGSSADRKIIAEYCVQDCALCNRLIIKLEIMANNIGMANVCLVPLNYIFMRGQGIKIFSLVMNECKEAGYLIPVIKAKGDVPMDDSYEGAIVLDPVPGIYIDEPVSVLDYASLYPSSMISENLSHDSLVLDSKYDNLPGVDYLDISYDVFDDSKNKVGERVCRYYQPKNGDKSLIPKILMKLLQARKTTRKRIGLSQLKADPSVKGWYNGNKHEFVAENGSILINVMPDGVEDVYDNFQRAVLDGLQNAYKITANSLYGQCGARTSQIYMKDIAACTTATGRRMIMKGKEFLESNYNANVVYGDTDSLFVIFNNNNKSLKRKDLILPSIEIARQASKEFAKIIKQPHDLEYEKTFWPFILLSKKRYVGNKYENDDIHYKQNSMGIVLKRRDNAPIVKKIYGGLIDIILDKQDINGAVGFLKNELLNMESNSTNIEDLVITKSLRGDYKDPLKIAHKVLADRMALRDPGNKPQANDRIPYVYVTRKGGYKKNVLQGERIEHVDYVRANKIKPDVQFYITNQVMNPVCQLLSIVVEQIPEFPKLKRDYAKEFKKLDKTKLYSRSTIAQKIINMKEADVEKMLFAPVVTRLENKTNGVRQITDWFTPV